MVGVAALGSCDGGEEITGVTGDYSLSLAPAALTIVQGADGNTTVTLARTDFTGAVTLSLGGAPAGVTGVFAPAAPTGTSSTLTVSVGAAVAPGDYNLTVNGTGSPGDRSTPLTLTVQAAPPTVSFTAATQSVAEDVGTATITAQLSQASTQTVTVPFTVTGSAADPADFTISASPLIIAAGSTTGTITVTVVADAVAEPDETGIVTMGTPTNATAGATTIHTLTISAQVPTVAFTTAAQSVAEGAGTATITAQLSQPSTQIVRVPYVLGGTATSPADYTITPSEITIAAGSTTGTLTVTLVADAIAEPDETVIVTMEAPFNATTGAIDVHTLTITGQAQPTVSFTAAAQTTNEGAVGTITAQLSSASSQVVTVPFTVGGTATSPADYTITASPLTIPAGNTTGTITVTVAADALVEPGETVVVTMGAPTNATQGATTVHTLTIPAQPAPTVSFTAAAQSVAEGAGTATITAQLSQASTQAVTIPFTMSGTAANPADYTITASPVVIAAGSTTATITVTLVADAVAEPDETVIVTMGAPTNAAQGATTVHTLTISGQTPTVSFTAAAQSVAEGVGTATITAQLSSASSQAVTVPFTVGGTAANPADYTITGSPVVIAAGATTGTITVTVVADAVAEPNETVIVTMGAPTNAAQGATTVHTLTITGQTPTVSFTAAAQSVAEGVGTATITAQLSSASSQAVTVPFTVTGTAANPADYTITASPVVIAAGATTGTITVTVVADGSAEPDETVIVTMGTPTNATQGATTVHTLTIQGSGGGGGNVTIDFSACPLQYQPLWLAAQDGAGAWMAVTGVGGIYQFNILSARGGMAYVTASSGDTVTHVMYLTQAQFIGRGAMPCGVPPTGKTINGTAAGIAVTDITTVSLGGGRAMPTVGAPNFQISRVADGTHDLVGYRRSLIAGPEAAIIRRDQNIPDGGSVGTLDFNGGEAFAPVTALITVAGLGGGETAIYNMNYFTGASCTPAGLASGAAGTTFTTAGIPGAAQRPSDFHGLSVSASQGTASRTVLEYFHTLGARTVTLGAALPVPAISTLPGAYTRLQAAYSLPADYTSSTTFTYDDGANRSVLLTATVGYLGGAAATLALADFSGLPGWNNAWAPATGSTGDWVTMGSGQTNFASPCEENATVRNAIVTGTY